MRRSNHENIDVLMLIGLVTEGEGEEGEGKSNSKVGTRWVRQKWLRFVLAEFPFKFLFVYLCCGIIFIQISSR